MMRAVPAAEILKVLNVPRPHLQPGERHVLLRVHATSLNRADILERKGAYPAPQLGIDYQGVLGLEAAGVIEEVSPAATQRGWKKGDRVMALLGGGGYAEYCLVHEDHVMPIPEDLSFVQAAAIPEVWLTSYQLLHLVGKVRKGDFCLVHGGGSGIGTAVTQLIASFGAKSIVTAGSAEKLAKCKELRADFGINYKEEDFVQKVKEITGGKGADVILDCIGGQYWEKNIEALAIDGRWVLYGTMGGAEVNGPLLGKLLRKRGQLIATTLRNRDNEYKKELVAAFRENALPLFTTGLYKPIIDQVFPLEKAMDAHIRMESNANIGKIVLDLQQN